MESEGEVNANSFKFMLYPAKALGAKSLWVCRLSNRVTSILMDMKHRDEFVQENQQSRSFDVILNVFLKSRIKSNVGKTMALYSASTPVLSAIFGH